ncbi:hypothetical protein QWY16_07410 [Planococcus shenhongbingii]|uniref:hypothetical protein n=1 Tax=Planococcus shenhongbingii TaxID=3058398 RepID=UPI002620DE15|nr:hypothetical protein [Planococcus sp. N016]WKA59927.1 hypothetical protein QWY16_07410 [Planococcus sp. N016]
MKAVRSEKGYALLMVLMLVLLFTVLGMGLLAMNMNAAKQFNKKEEQVQARHQAEMGVIHYEAVLKDKIASSTSNVLTCNDVEALLGSNKKLEKGMYNVVGVEASGASCKEIEAGKTLEISIKSLGTVNVDTQKEVIAKFYANNIGGDLEQAEESTNTIQPPLEEPGSGKKVDSLSLTKHSGTEASTFSDNLTIKSVLSTGTGFETVLKAKKHLFINGIIMPGNVAGQSMNLNNHTCIGVGGNFTALTQIDWGGQSSIELLVRKDAYLPSDIINWKDDKTKVFVFGNLYLPQNYKYITHNKKVAEKSDVHIYIGGKVYQENNLKKYTEIVNPFHSLKTTQMRQAYSLSCTIPEMLEENGDIPNWMLQDNIDISYQ